jgi:WD40 repeat protein
MPISAWGSRDISAVAATGNATQLFPNDTPATVSTAAYPPAGGGLVRRATAGVLQKLHIMSDGVNGGTLEIWDVEGVDRGASNNVNDQLLLTNAFLVANGKLIDTIRITGSSDNNYSIWVGLENLQFNKGLAVRFANAGPAGKVTVSPFVSSGFMVQHVAG